MPGREAAWRRWVPSVIAALIRGVGRTMRLETVNAEAIMARWRRGEASIIAFWHGRQLMLPLAYHGSGLTILISRHRDGELISRAMVAFGFSAARGSTTRGGAVGLRALVDAGRKGRDVAVTPDGPRGPREVVQPGVIQLARLTGLPIVPLAFGASKKKSFAPGTGFSSRSRSRAACSCGGTRSGFHATWERTGLRSAAARWSRR
ncbi:MAG: DUF374 domain-containing protein [Nitrospirae bacterium]|nr:DUF374 domain-containing protein [Nitrospirota bacterium]